MGRLQQVCRVNCSRTAYCDVHRDSNWPERASLWSVHGQPQRAKKGLSKDRRFTNHERHTTGPTSVFYTAPERPRMDVSLAPRGPWSPGRRVPRKVAILPCFSVPHMNSEMESELYGRQTASLVGRKARGLTCNITAPRAILTWNHLLFGTKRTARGARQSAPAAPGAGSRSQS